MCSISGAFALTKPIAPLTYRAVLSAAKERGRDSIGVAWDGPRGGLVLRAVGSHADSEPITDALSKIAPDRYVLANNRATPTTEWVRGLDADQVQPYETDRFIVVHNGTIANDRELATELGMAAPAIDSQIIGPVLEAEAEKSSEFIRPALDRLTGSYALAVYDKWEESLTLAANYKPIHTAVVNGVLYFASQPHHLPSLADVGDEFGSTVRKLDPYSWATFHPGGEIETGQLLDEPTNHRSLVVLSGGLDSTVVLSTLLAEGHDVAALHISYGARANEEEVAAVNAICDRLGVELIHVTTDLFTNTIKASRLTNTHDEIAGGEAGAELAFEWVPARNLIMSSIAVGIAEARGFNTIALGNNLEESGAYPDNEQEFIRALNLVMPNAVNAGQRVRFVEPLGNLMKHEIVSLGASVDAPFELSWSCYNHGAKHCGDCGPCYMRHTAFLMNDLPDPTDYEQDPRP